MEENDPMKDFIQRNRSDFDDQDLPDNLWKSIESNLPETEKSMRMVPLRNVLRVAAGIAIVVAIGLTVLFNTRDLQETPMAEQTEVKTDSVGPGDIYEFAPELAEAAFYYQTRISETANELSTYEIKETDYESLRILEKDLEMLKRELGNQVDNERLIQAMMQNYQYRLSMLERMLNDVKDLNDAHENKYNEDDAVVPM